MKIFNLLPPGIRPYLLIITGNLIPLIGYIWFHWNLTEAFLFYAAELCAYELIMIPRVVIFVITSDEYFLESSIKKIGLSFSWLLYHLGFFTFTMMFLLHTAFAVSATTAIFSMKKILFFLNVNFPAVIYIFADYIYEFYTNQIKLKEYEVLESDFHLKEIALFYLLLLTILAIINGISVGLSLNSKLYQLVMMLIIICFKTASQVLLKKGKKKLYSKRKSYSLKFYDEIK